MLCGGTLPYRPKSSVPTTNPPRRDTCLDLGRLGRSQLLVLLQGSGLRGAGDSGGRMPSFQAFGRQQVGTCCAAQLTETDATTPQKCTGDPVLLEINQAKESVKLRFIAKSLWWMAQALNYNCEQPSKMPALWAPTPSAQPENILSILEPQNL